jgi:hypothetical protein
VMRGSDQRKPVAEDTDAEFTISEIEQAIRKFNFSNDKWHYSC